MDIISNVLGVISFLVGLPVLIKLFKKEGTVKGILGLICMLYTFIWGWMHHKEENVTIIMIVWTLVTIAEIAVIGIMMSQVANAVPASWLVPFAG